MEGREAGDLLEGCLRPRQQKSRGSRGDQAQWRLKPVPLNSAPCSALLLVDSCDVTYGFHWDYYFVVVVVFATPWTTTHQSAPSFTISYPMECNTPGSPVHHCLQRLLKFVSIESVMLSNYLILCRLIFLLTSVFPSIRVFSNESALHIRWTKY